MKISINNWLKNNQWLNYRHFTQHVFKQSCLLCASPEGNRDGLCSACLNDLPYSPATSCPQCGLSSNGLVCGSCISAPPDFDLTRAVFTYTFPIDAMMKSYKYGDALHISRTFGRLLAEKIESSTVDLIIPMPMHPARLKERGFNQALEIAKVLGNDKLDYKSAIRQKLTPPQASLPLKERVKNIKGAFAVSADLTGKRIAIVDDVMTTGASFNELAKTLKKTGASHVECWVIARTFPHR
jgi:ComF family protein